LEYKKHQESSELNYFYKEKVNQAKIAFNIAKYMLERYFNFFAQKICLSVDYSLLINGVYCIQLIFPYAIFSIIVIILELFYFIFFKLFLINKFYFCYN